MGKYCFLVLEYKDEYYFWEYVIWARKILFALVGAALSGTSDNTIASFELISITLIFLISQIMQITFKPYKYEVLNEMAASIGWYALVSLLLCFLNHNGFFGKLFLGVVNIIGSIVYLIWFIKSYHS